MICSYCGTECDGLPDGPEVRDDDKFIIHGLARCRDALKAQLATMTKRVEDAERCNANYVEMTKGAMGQASDDAARASINLRRAEAAEAKLAALREAGITIDDVQTFAAFTPEAKAAYPEKPQYLIRTKGVELRQTEAEAKLATAVEGLREIAGRALSYAGWAAECARSTLRALSIDPSKEQGK